jgi:hypothetical protein
LSIEAAVTWPKFRNGDIGGRVSKIRMVDGVEGFSAELAGEPLRDGEALDGREVETNFLS